MSNYTKQINIAEIELRRKAKLFKKARITKLVRLETVKYELLKHYAKENNKTMSKMLDKIFYFYEVNQRS
jgi:hypothetical protein